MAFSDTDIRFLAEALIILHDQIRDELHRGKRPQKHCEAEGGGQPASLFLAVEFLGTSFVSVAAIVFSPFVRSHSNHLSNRSHTTDDSVLFPLLRISFLITPSHRQGYSNTCSPKVVGINREKKSRPDPGLTEQP